MKLNIIKILTGCLICLVFFTAKLWAYTDFYDIKGDLLFNGDPLYEFWTYGSPTGGFQNNFYNVYANQDRFMRDFGSSVNLYEWINGREYELKMGRFDTRFTPLTLQLTRLRWGYFGSYYNSWFDWGKWWDQRNARIRATQGNDEWVGMIAKTAFYNSSGSDNAEQGWSKNINKDQYFVALRRKTEIFGLKMGFSMVNQHFTNFKTNDMTQPDFLSSQGPLVGVIDDNLPEKIYLRFTDDSPKNEAGESDWAGAAVYEIRTFVNGDEIPSLSVAGASLGTNVSNADSGPYSISPDKLEASGPSDSLIYAFNMTGVNATYNKKITSVKFMITVANDYRIESSRDKSNYTIVARAPGNIKDLSNKTIITYAYGDETGTTVLGYDIEGNIPGLNVPFKGEVAASKKFFKFPNASGERTEQVANAWYMTFSKEFRSVLLMGEVYDTDYNYAASFSVEDNDDKDDKPDIVDEYVPLYKEYPGIRTDDDFILFKLDTRFREGLDLNNNVALDNEENDIKSDYPYREGQKGYVFSSAYRPFQGMKLESVFVNSADLMSDRRNQTVFGKLKYNFSFSKVGVDLRHEIKNTKDNIPDSLVYDPNNPAQATNVNQATENWSDPLTYRDNTVNNTYVTVNYTLFKKLAFTNRYLYGMDRRYYSDQFNEYQNGIVKIFYNDWYPFKRIPALKQWMVTPMYKLERWNEQSTSNIDFITLIGNWRKDAFALILNNKMTEKTSIFVGEQVVIYDDLLLDNDDIRYVFATEMVHSDQYWNRPIMVSAGIKYVNQEAVKEANRQKYEFIYLKAYFQW